MLWKKEEKTRDIDRCGEIRPMLLRLQGNEYYNQDNFAEAIKCYTQSLNFAEKNSKDATIAYANRSACFYTLEMFDEAIADIEFCKNTRTSTRISEIIGERLEDTLYLKAEKENVLPLFLK